MNTNKNTHFLSRLLGVRTLATGAVLVAAIAPAVRHDDPVATNPLLVKSTAAVQLLPSHAETIPFKEARIYWEYNASANDLGVHVSLDAEDWKKLQILNPSEKTLFEVRGKGPYQALGMTELFFEGAEPSLAQFPLAELLRMFPEGDYEFSGITVSGEELESISTFSHAIPAGPNVRSVVGPGNFLSIQWDEVTSPPAGFPNKPINIAGYQVIVGKFLVTLPASARSVTVPPEFAASLASGVQPYEVLAIEMNGNQTLTEGTFVK